MRADPATLTRGADLGRAFPPRRPIPMLLLRRSHRQPHVVECFGEPAADVTPQPAGTMMAANDEPPMDSRRHRRDRRAKLLAGQRATAGSFSPGEENWLDVRSAGAANRDLGSTEQPSACSTSRRPTSTTRISSGRWSGRRSNGGKNTVGPNDNYWNISEKKALLWQRRLFQAPCTNTIASTILVRGDKLQVGDVIDAPAATLLAERYPDLCPCQRKSPGPANAAIGQHPKHRAGDRVYMVGEGDTLFDIARHELGKASRWVEIFDMNHDVLGEDFDYLRPGTELLLPRDNRDNDNDDAERRAGTSIILPAINWAYGWLPGDMSCRSDHRAHIARQPA